MARRTNELVVILWRDIPAQVNVHVGRERRQRLLAERFQRAIDRAKRKAKIQTAQDEVAQWRRESRPLDGDAEAAVTDAVARLEADYPRPASARWRSSAAGHGISRSRRWRRHDAHGVVVGLARGDHRVRRAVRDDRRAHQPDGAHAARRGDEGR
ncbi:MAG: virulence factor [Ilumatobacteraceae bacterium]